MSRPAAVLPFLRRIRGRWLAACLVLPGGILSAQPARTGGAIHPVPPVFGAMTHFAQGWDPALVPQLAAAGVTAVRDELYWAVVEPRPGEFRFPASYDAYMSALQAAGIAPLIELTFENPHYDRGLTPHTAEGFSAYARYATAVLQRYGPQIKALEIWNEYNGTWCRGPATADRAGTYAQMLHAAYAAIKRERPDVTVVGGATAGLPLPYLERLFAAGALQWMDAVSIHPYRSDSPPEGIELQVAALRRLIARYNGGRTIPIWVTEIGWGTRAAAAPGDLAIDEETQARFLVRALVLLASSGVDRVYWYLARDDRMTPTMGFLRNDSAFTPKPAARALAALNARLHDALFVARETAAGGVYSLRFTRTSGGDVRVLWSLAPFPLAIGADTTVTDLYGRALAPAADGTITVGDSPVFICGQLPTLPAAASPTAQPVAESFSGFSAAQGRDGWSYGAFVGDTTAFRPLARYRITDWKEEWTDVFPFISVTAGQQHPGRSGATPVAAVRRWTSDFAGRVRIAGRFKATTKGDGVRARILVDGQTVYDAALGGGRAIAATFDLTQPVHAGSTLDFAVDPGPAANLDDDATDVAIVVERITP